MPALMGRPAWPLLSLLVLAGCGDSNPPRPWPTDLPENREDGSHLDLASDAFYEGWYYKVALPEQDEAFFFIYSVQNPKPDTPLPRAAYVYCGRQKTLESVYESHPVEAYWAADDHRDVRIGEHSRGTALRFAGQAQQGDNTCSWDIDLTDGVAWTETMGLLTGVQGLETNWTVGTLRAGASGWIRWNDELIRFDSGVAYCDHNWGMIFPREWIWLQAASFPGSDAAVAAAGGTVPYGDQELEALMIGFLLEGTLHTFRSQDADLMAWDAAPGTWSLSGERERKRIHIEASCDPATLFHLLVPTTEGMLPRAWESLVGSVSVTLETREATGHDWHVAFQGTSQYGGVEIGE